MRLRFYILLATTWFISQSPIYLTAQFAEVSASIGITDIVGSPDHGSGVSFVDFNGDGFDDLTFGTEVGQPLLFYQNVQGITYTKVDLGIIDSSEQKQVLWVDFDNDGDLDFFFTSYYSSNKLYENDGNLNFTDISISAGFPNQDLKTYGAAFGDIDLDGDLDLAYLNYCNGDCNNYLFENNGDKTFTDITTSSGTEGEQGPGLAIAMLDYDKDLYPDIFTAIDKVWENKLYKNLQNNTFQDESSATGLDDVICAMNAGIGDIDNDGFQDIYVTNGLTGNLLMQNDGNGNYTDIAASSGTQFLSVCWGGSFADFDNDGFQDLYVCSNYDVPPATPKNILYMNNGDDTFNEVFLPGDITKSYSNTYGDFNNDGLLDIVTVSGHNENLLVFENTDDNGHYFLKVELEGDVSNRDAIGAWIEVYADDLHQKRYTHCGQGYMSQESHRIHFGLKENSLVDSLIIKWPSGNEDRYFNISANVSLSLTEDCLSCYDCEYYDESIYAEDPIESGDYHQVEIEATGKVVANNDVSFLAENQIELKNDFESETGSTLTIDIKQCLIH